MKETQVEWCNTEGSLLSSKISYYYSGSFPASARFLNFPADPEETKTCGLPNLNEIEFDHTHVTLSFMQRKCWVKQTAMCCVSV